jgi:hypothetical protein
MLNGLTGKFGQRFIPKKIHFFRVDEEINCALKGTTAIRDYETDEVLMWMGWTESDYEYAPFPIHLSSFILGWSKVEMSTRSRQMQLYINYYNIPAYGDTDSLIVKHDNYMLLPEDERGDSELGQMKLEINGKMVAIWVLSPKNYAYVYIDAKDKKIKAAMKSKGIPHPRDYYNPFELYKLNEQEEEYINGELSNIKDKNGPSISAKVKYKGFAFYDKEGELIHLSSRIPIPFLTSINNGEMIANCIFGGMIRVFGKGYSKDIYIVPDTRLREFNKTKWWENGHRILHDEFDEDYLLSLPPGHKRIGVV